MIACFGLQVSYVGDAKDGQEIETVRATFEVAADEVVLFPTGHRGI